MTQNNLILTRNNQKSIVFDVFYAKTQKPKPLVIFCHGYKGFKDWGAWNLVADAFKNAELFFVKFNFSHNGGTVEQPIDFPDLEAFAENNYTKELQDLDDILNHVLNDADYKNEVNPNNITLIGHSRAGGIVTIKASEDTRITKVISWAGVCDFAKRTATIGDLPSWKRDVVKYVLNGRTKQQMPHNYQFYEDFKQNEDRLDIEAATKRLNIAHLIIHATDDPAVKYSEAEALHSWNSKSQLFPVENSNHVFGASHPWEENTLPEALKMVTDESIAFVKM
jgi:pimeloyl-ACP methyl ester carboxylesterase